MLEEFSTGLPARRILIAGSSGMIGTPLTQLLRDQGHAVHTLVRREPRDGTEHQWSPELGTIDSGIIDYTDVVINLAGASIGKIPWTKGHKEKILSSRISTATTLADAISNATTPPSLLIQGSAVGFYGGRGDEDLTESSKRGEGFLADVVQAWEGAALGAASPKTRVCCARTGLVVGPGGAMAPLKLQTLLGVGGRIGPGTQWWPWISLHDEVRALAHLANDDTVQTVFNLVGPTPATALEMTTQLASSLKRPHWLGLPSFAIKALMGEAGEALLLASQKVRSEHLELVGFTCDDQTLEQAISRMLGNRN
jgi:uncharacterized protein